MEFYTGSHKAGWLADPAVNFPLFVSHRTLSKVRRLRRATCRWALDSGGFTELSTYGEWRTSPREYVAAVAHYDREIGGLDWAAPQDWMCEPVIIHGGEGFPGTGKSVEEHQHLTVHNLLVLRNLWPQFSDARCPFVPVLQGWTMGDYLRCEELYAEAGVDLAAERAVGLGSVCRRQNTIRIGLIVSLFADRMRLHGFGVKISGLASYGHQLASADSMAWSLDARRADPMPGHSHKSCANCATYAGAWRSRVLAKVMSDADRGFEAA